MSNAIYGKTMENLRNRIDVNLENNEKDYLKCTSTPSYMSPNIFDNNVVAIRKSKIALKFYNPAYNEMSTLDLSKLCMNFVMIILKINMATNHYLLTN